VKLHLCLALPLIIVMSPVISQAMQSPQGQQEKIQIAILDLDALGVSEDEARAVTERLRSRLNELDVFDLIERNRMNQILEEQSFQISGACTDMECAVQIGQLLQVRKMVVGSVSKVGDLYSLMIRLVDVETARIEYSAESDEQGIENVFTQATRDVAEQLSAHVTGQQVTPRRRPQRQSSYRNRTDPFVLTGTTVRIFPDIIPVEEMGIFFSAEVINTKPSNWSTLVRYSYANFSSDQISMITVGTGVFKHSFPKNWYWGLMACAQYWNIDSESNNWLSIGATIFIGQEGLVGQGLNIGIRATLTPIYVFAEEAFMPIPSLAVTFAFLPRK